MKPEQKTMEQVIASLPISDIDGGFLPDHKRLKIAMKEWEQITNKERDERLAELEEMLANMEAHFDVDREYFKESNRIK